VTEVPAVDEAEGNLDRLHGPSLLVDDGPRHGRDEVELEVDALAHLAVAHRDGALAREGAVLVALSTDLMRALGEPGEVV
jgi:hypothetical protein